MGRLSLWRIRPAARLAVLFCGITSMAHASPSAERWIATWAASPSTPLPQTLNLPFADPAPYTGTLRYVVRLSAGGDRIRLRISNELGAEPITIGAASIALQADGPDARVGSIQAFTFSGRPSARLAPGDPVLSDPISFRVAPGTDLVVSLFLPSPTKTMAGGAIHKAFISAPGEDLTQASIFPKDTLASRPLVSEIDVATGKPSSVIVTLGDSITDGERDYDRPTRGWPGLLADRLNLHRRVNYAVVNAGIGGNRLLSNAMGPNALARLDRDVISVPGAKQVILLEGINDLGLGGRGGEPAPKAEDLLWAYRQIIVRCHSAGLAIIGGTLTPSGGSIIPGYSTEEKERVRLAINSWIRNSGAFDGVIDFDATLRDPTYPGRINPAFDSGDHLHPSGAGYEAMALAAEKVLLHK